MQFGGILCTVALTYIHGLFRHACMFFDGKNNEDQKRLTKRHFNAKEKACKENQGNNLLWAIMHHHDDIYTYNG